MKYLIGLLLIFQLWYGVNYMWFHQDDLNWMKLAQQSYREQITTPVTEHINYLFRVMFKTEYIFFEWNYHYYLVVSLLLHAISIMLVGLITAEVTKRRELGWLAAGLFTINTNWNEVVLWISGQTISITAVWVLLTIYYVMRRESTGKIAGAMLGASITSGLAAWLPIATLIAGGGEKRIRVISAAVLAMILAIYWGASAGVSGEIGRNPIIMAEVASLGVINTVLGRLWWPFEVGERVRIALTLGMIMIGGKYVPKLLKNRQTLLLAVALVLYYAMVAIGRAQYGIGMMRAERYAYMGLALVLPLLFYLAKTVRKQWLTALVVSLMLVQVGGFITRANRYIGRPKEVKAYYERMVKLDKSVCYQDMILPWAIFQNNQTKLSEYSSLWKGLKIGGGECKKI